MKKEELNERILDEIIRYAVIKEMEETQWPSHEELAAKYLFSDKFEANMQILFRDLKRQELITKIKNASLKTAAVILLLFAVSFGAIMSVEAYRVTVLNFFLERSRESTTISIGSNNNDYPGLQSGLLPEYLPVGYVNILYQDIGDYYFAIFRNEAGDEIYLEKLSEGSSAGIDSEYAYIEHLTVNGYNAQYYRKNNTGTLLFKYGGHVFLLSAPLPKEELVKIAESFRF